MTTEITLDEVQVKATPINPAPVSTKPSFVFRILKVVFTGADGSVNTFDGTPASLTPFRPGLEIEVNIENTLLPTSGGIASIWIHGMTLSQINQLSISGTMWRISSKTKVQIFAGDSSSSNLTLIYSGPVTEARPDFSRQPNVSFFIFSPAGVSLQMDNTVTPTSINGAATAQVILQQICEKIGITLEYSAPDVTLSYHYSSGGAWEQIDEVVSAAKLRSHFEGTTNTLRVFSQTGFIPGNMVTISPANGMINYPDFQRNLITVKTIFDSEIAKGLRMGGRVQIQSQLKAATGIFVINYIKYNLSCNSLDDGLWEVTVSAYPSIVGASGDP